MEVEANKKSELRQSSRVRELDSEESTWASENNVRGRVAINRGLFIYPARQRGSRDR